MISKSEKNFQFDNNQLIGTKSDAIFPICVRFVICPIFLISTSDYICIIFFTLFVNFVLYCIIFLSYLYYIFYPNCTIFSLHLYHIFTTFVLYFTTFVLYLLIFFLPNV